MTLLKVKVEEFDIDQSVNDPHVACSLLKLWLREMSLPLFPVELSAQVSLLNFYSGLTTVFQFLEASDSPEESVECIKQLPEINQKSLMHILRFLQVFSKPTVTHLTRMDSGMFQSFSYRHRPRINDDFG